MIRVVWICHYSDAKTRSYLRFRRLYLLGLLKRLFGRFVQLGHDFAVWIPNAIKEFENRSDTDLTVIFPHDGISGRLQRFSIGRIKYVCFHSQDDTLFAFLQRHVLKHTNPDYRKNRKLVASLIDDIKPNVVHVIGAENPYYSSTCLDLPRSIPCVLSLQTLMSTPGFKDNYNISPDSYEHRSFYERLVIQRCDYIGVGTHNQEFVDVIKTSIKPDAIFLRLSLALGVDINDALTDKKYDFVYFAANISKACDHAIEAFALLHKKYPLLTLNISGSCHPDERVILERRVVDLGIRDVVFFTGALESHDDVIDQIKKSKFAILPLKVDLISGTIREAMACGLPVVTTITPATPELNINRESVLLAPKGDFDKLATLMARLVEDRVLADTLRENAFLTIKEDYSNESFMNAWRKAYGEIIENYNNGSPFSQDIIY